ncbi:hypothetical protein MAUB1S_08443 [Mycolicibacterium aubagnense]
MSSENPLTDPAHPDIDEALIARLVRTFYERARADDLIGPIFAAAVHDWDEHIANITAFWSSVILRSGRYNGRPMRPHLTLPLENEHFDRWLALFEATAKELCSPGGRERLHRPGAPDRRQFRNGDRYPARGNPPPAPLADVAGAIFARLTACRQVPAVARRPAVASLLQPSPSIASNGAVPACAAAGRVRPEPRSPEGRRPWPGGRLR